MGTVSYWHARERAVEVVVVGAGIAGLSASHELTRRGVEHVVLERGIVGQEASTRNAGFLMRGAADNYAAACRDFGRERARELWRLSEENLRLLRELGVGELRGYRPRPSCLLAVEGGELAELRESERLLEEDGFRVEWADRGDDAAWRGGLALGGLINPDDAVCDPAELVRWLARPVFERVRQGVEVRAIARDGGGISVRTGRGEVRCGRVLVCTNAFAGGLLGSMRGRVTARRGQMLALRAPEVRLDCAYYVNHGHEYVREAGDGVVVVGGCRGMFAEQEVGEEDATAENVQGAIEEFAGRFLGRRFEVIARWAGIMGFAEGGSERGLPIVEAVEGFDGRVWFCGGFTGHGMSLGHVTSRRAVGEMLGG